MEGAGGTTADGTGGGTRDRFRALLRERLREQPYPLFCFAEGVIPAASIWTGSRLWVEVFRNAGLVPGDRILIVLPPSPAWLQVFVAALWEGLSLAFAPESRSVVAIDTVMNAVDARAAVGTIDERHFFNADWCAGPLSVPDSLRKARYPAAPEARFLLRTSGTESGDGRWIGLSDTGVLSVVQSHLPHLGLKEETSRVLSTLPWSHAFGLVIDLLPAMLSGAEIHRNPGSGRDTDTLLDTFEDAGITDFCAVPLTVKRLATTERGARFLRSLRGGVIGGAPIDAPLSEFLRTTRLRVGYGQTEASPGIALGEPGVFPGPRYLGRALGCETRISDTQTLAFRGTNACAGMWSAEHGFNPLAPDRWQDTGDLVESNADGDLFFVGRSDAAFKLANGRRIEPEPLENTLRQAFPEVEHLFMYSEEGETLTICSDLPVSRDAAVSLLGSPGKLIFRTFVAPTEAFRYTPKGTLRREATRESLRSHMLQFPHANRPSDPPLYTAIDSFLDASLVELAEMVAVPSVAAQPDSPMLRGAELVAELLKKRGLEVRILPTTEGAPPVVYAEDRSAGVDAPTVLFYNHYDVQPAEPLELWDSDPWVLRRHGDFLYGRGVSDDKGHISCRLLALDAIKATHGGTLPFNVKVLVEGEEEVASVHLSAWIADHSALLNADVTIWEFGGVDETGRPEIICGLRGIAYFELHAQTIAYDAHSGIGGSVLPNAAWRLVWALGTLKTRGERILLPGHYDTVLPPSDADIELLAGMPAAQEAFLRKEFAPTDFLGGATGVEYQRRAVFEPTCTINGIESGYTGAGAKTVLPAKAFAKVDFRLVPDQDPDTVHAALRKHLDANGFSDIEIKYLGGQRPGRVDPNHPYVRLAAETAREVYGKEPCVYPLVGGSGPIHPFVAGLRQPFVTCGVGYPGARVHAPNENLRVSDLILGARHTARFLLALSDQYVKK